MKVPPRRWLSALRSAGHRRHGDERVGLCQMGEVIGLATMTELPLVVIDVQRGGPSTGLPTKTEQSTTSGDVRPQRRMPGPGSRARLAQRWLRRERRAARIACKFMTPVIVLTDVFLTNGSEPWRIPEAGELPVIAGPLFDSSADFAPYARNASLARRGKCPARGARAPRRRARKRRRDRAVSYDPLNHEKMVRLRAEKVAGIAADIPELTAEARQRRFTRRRLGQHLRGHRDRCAVRPPSRRGGRSRPPALSESVARNMGELLKRYRRVLVPELNSGQLLMLLRVALRDRSGRAAQIQGRPFLACEIEEAIDQQLRNALVRA